MSTPSVTSTLVASPRGQIPDAPQRLLHSIRLQDIYVARLGLCSGEHPNFGKQFGRGGEKPCTVLIAACTSSGSMCSPGKEGYCSSPVPIWRPAS